MLLADCAGTLPPSTGDAPSLTRVAPAGTPLADAALRAGIGADLRGLATARKCVCARRARRRHRVVYVGSLNLDNRSAHINTELGVRIDSGEIVRMLFMAFRIEQATGVVRVRLEARSLPAGLERARR